MTLTIKLAYAGSINTTWTWNILVEYNEFVFNYMDMSIGLKRYVRWMAWISIAQFGGCRWIWKDKTWQIKLMGTRNQRRK